MSASQFHTSSATSIAIASRPRRSVSGEPCRLGAAADGQAARLYVGAAQLGNGDGTECMTD